MDILTVKRKNIIKVSILAVCVSAVFIFSRVFGMQNYYNTGFSTGLVTASTLNVRSGPGTAYKVIASVKYGDYIRVFAGVGDWYIVQVEGDYVGAVSKKYIKPIYSNSNNQANQKTDNTQTTSTMTSDEKEVFNLINTQRTNNGLSPLKVDNEVQRVARIKAQDMVANNYFAHESPTYGTPFQMLQNFKISYKTARGKYSWKFK